MMPRLLTLCFPTYGGPSSLHIDSTGQHVVLAPDEMHVFLAAQGWAIHVVSLADPTHLTLMRSKLPLLTANDIDVDSYDLYWHMFRDPTQPEVLEKLQELRLSNWIPTINSAELLMDHHKYRYAPLLHSRGIGPAVLSCSDDRAGWTEAVGNRISPDRCLIDTNAYNNNRGEYPERGHGRIVTEFIDNFVNGRRSIVRFGVAYGEGFRGFQYFSSDVAYRSGAATHVEPYEVPAPWRSLIAMVLKELHVDVCHVEAIPVPGRLQIIDINPYPTADGMTLSLISKDLAEIVNRRFATGVNG